MTLRLPNPPASEQLLASYEATAAILLPQDYRDFLKSCNGGQQPVPEAFRVTSTGEESFLSEFFPCGDGTKRDLLAFQRFLAESLPEKVLPIGEDLGGNYICMATQGNKQGKIFFLDHETIDDPTDDPWQKLAFCADSFSKFIDGLFDPK